MVTKPLPGQRVFVVEETGISYAKGPSIETEVAKVSESHERTKVELKNGLVLVREGEETKWHTDDMKFRVFVMLNNKPDLRHLRTTHKLSDAHEAAVFFTQAAAVGGGEAPKELSRLLVKAEVSNFDGLFHLVRVANENSRKNLHHRSVYQQSSFIFRDDGREVNAIVWQCLSPQCGYSAPPTRIVAKEEGDKIVIELSGRPDGLWKRLKYSKHRFEIQEIPL